MEPLLLLLDRFLHCRSIDEVIALVDAHPEALSPEFFDVMGLVRNEAARRGDVELAAGIERLGQVLAAMRGDAPATGDTRLFAALADVRVLAELADSANWPGWAGILAANPFLHSVDFIDHLIGVQDVVCAEDRWVLDALVQLLVQCHEKGVAATLPLWVSTATAGEGAFLPAELQLAALEHFAEVLAPQQDLMTAEIFGNLGKVLYHRQLGDRADNLGRAEQALRASIELAEAGGDVMMRASSQQALVNVVLGVNETDPDNAQAALSIATEALEGWDHDSDHELWGLLMTSRANCLRTLRRADEAIDSYHQALTVFPREKDARRWGIAMFGLGSAYLDRAKIRQDRDVDQAIECLGQAAEVRTREVDEARWAITEDALAWAHFTRHNAPEDLEKAAGHFRNALEFYPPGGMQRAQALSGLGQVLLDLNRDRIDLVTAKELLEQSLEVPGPPHPADTYRALALACRRLDESDPAAAVHQQRAIDLSTPDSSSYVGDVLMLASYLSFGQQVDGYTRAIARLTPLLPERSGGMKATLLFSLGTLHANNPLGDEEQNSRLAMECYQEALAECGENAEPWLWAQLHCMIASLVIERESRFDEYDDAKRQRREEVFRLLEVAMDAAVRDGNDEGINQVRRMLVEARSTYEDSQPIEDLEAVRDHYRAKRDVAGFARAQAELAEAYGSTDRRAVWAAETARRLLPMSTSPIDFGRASERLGFVLVQQGDQERGGRAYHDAVRARHLALRLARLPSDEHRVRTSFRGNLAEQACFAFARAAEHTTDPAHRRALTALAVESLDGGRMRGFAEFAAAHLDEVARVDPALVRSYEDALARFRASTRADRAVVTGSPVGPQLVADDTAGWLASRDKARVALADLDRVLLTIRDRTGLDLTVPPLAVPEIAALLGPDEALAYLLCDDAGNDGTNRQLVLLVKADGEVVLRWTPGRIDAFYQVATWLPNQSAFSTASAAKLLADALDEAFPAAAEVLTGPLAKELRAAGATRVHLVPCGILVNFPFHAAPAPDRPLGEEFAVSYLPSAALLKSLRHRGSVPGPSRVLTVANPLPNPNPLPFAKVQQALVAAAARDRGIPSVELAEHDATGQAVREAMATATHLDFACHGSLNQAWMLESGLTLSDGPLVLRDVLDSDLLQRVRLVTLTSCQSGAAPGNPFNDEPMSFATGFLVAGAAAVLGTLWLVDDLATALLSGRFYHHYLVDELPLPQALGRAQRWLRELTAADLAAELGEESTDPVHELIHPFEHPLYWASFVLSCE